MKKRTIAKPEEPRRLRKREVTPYLFLLCFSLDEPGEPDHVGRFQLVVEATNPENAVDRARTRLRRLRTSTTLFDSPVTIYLDGIIGLTGSFKDGLLVNWESEPAPPSPYGSISCLIPEQTDHGADSWGWEPAKRKKGEDNTIQQPFLDFGGEKFRRARAAGEGRANAGLDHPPARSAAPPISLTHPRTAPRKAATAPPSAIRTAASKTAAQAKREEAQARRLRREALAATVAELRGSNKKRRDAPA